MSDAVPFTFTFPFTVSAAGFAMFTVGAVLSIAKLNALSVVLPALSVTVTTIFGVSVEIFSKFAVGIVCSTTELMIFPVYEYTAFDSSINFTVAVDVSKKPLPSSWNFIL